MTIDYYERPTQERSTEAHHLKSKRLASICFAAILVSCGSNLESTNSASFVPSFNDASDVSVMGSTHDAGEVIGTVDSSQEVASIEDAPQERRGPMGPVLCNGKTCLETQYCVSRLCAEGCPVACSTGARLDCPLVPDSGVCPDGSVLSTAGCRHDMLPGCVCPDPKPQCVDAPTWADGGPIPPLYDPDGAPIASVMYDGFIHPLDYHFCQVVCAGPRNCHVAAEYDAVAADYDATKTYVACQGE
jgi:hypothetical protein